MVGGAQLSVVEMRRSGRHPVNFPVIGEHRTRGDVHLLVTNISAHGFMVEGDTELGRGERIVIRLPQIGRIEAHVIWVTAERAGFQNERVLRQDEFVCVIEALQPNPRLRLSR